MTRMSDPTAVQPGQITPNRSRSQAPTWLAHGVHAIRCVVSRSLVLGSLVMGGCVIPPSLSVGNEDAGVNSPPAILAVRSDQQELPPGEAVVFDRGSGAINLTLIDTDLTDTLYVRVFVDYKVGDPTPARASCTAAPPTPAAAQRSVTCDVSAVCKSGDVGKPPLSMTVVVFDRQLLESGTPAFQAMPIGGLKTSLFYFLTCQEPTQ